MQGGVTLYMGAIKKDPGTGTWLYKSLFLLPKWVAVRIIIPFWVP